MTYVSLYFEYYTDFKKLLSSCTRVTEILPKMQHASEPSWKKKIGHQQE